MFPPKEMEALTIVHQYLIPRAGIMCCAKNRCKLPLASFPCTLVTWGSCPDKQYCDPSRLHTIDICPSPIGRYPKTWTSLAWKPRRAYNSWSSSTAGLLGCAAGGLFKLLPCNVEMNNSVGKQPLSLGCVESRLQPSDFTRC